MLGFSSKTRRERATHTDAPVGGRQREGLLIKVTGWPNPQPCRFSHRPARYSTSQPPSSLPYPQPPPTKKSHRLPQVSDPPPSAHPANPGYGLTGPRQTARGGPPTDTQTVAAAAERIPLLHPPFVLDDGAKIPPLSEILVIGVMERGCNRITERRATESTA